MKKIRVMDSTGDTVIEFDETLAMKDKATLEAEALFDRLTKNSAAVFAVNRGEGQPDKRVTHFNELGEENIIVPRIVGG